MTGDREPGHAPEQDRSLENQTAQRPNNRERRIQQSLDRLRKPMIPDVN